LFLQLPQELQERVASYKVELQNYNEYINPYADADSDSELDVNSPQKRKPGGDGEVRVLNL